MDLKFYSHGDIPEELRERIDEWGHNPNRIRYVVLAPLSVLEKEEYYDEWDSKSRSFFRPEDHYLNDLLGGSSSLKKSSWIKGEDWAIGISAKR